MHIPSLIDPSDRSPDACRERALHAQQMMELRPNGDGFRRIPEHSSQTSIVERHLIEAGDMKAPPSVPSDRRYRSVRRPKDERHARMERVAKKEQQKLQPMRHRDQNLEPSDQLIEQVLGAYKSAKSPAELALALVGRMGFPSVDAYDKAATRAERFVRDLKPGKRMPNHIRDKFVLKRVVERCLEKRFGAAQVAQA